MKYNELSITRQKKAHQVGRGISAGRGKTAGRGTKGQGARKSPQRLGFEGGQTPLHMRLPKLRGFKSRAEPTENVYTGQLDKITHGNIDAYALAEAGLISNPYLKVKLIKKGELKSKKTVKLPSASQTAIEAIKKSGGSFEKTNRVPRPKKLSDKS
ncbi:MAG: 50S ribosomal protein L15 [Candidatus Saccharimonadales bacterium]